MASGAIINGRLTFGAGDGQLQIHGTALPINTFSGFEPGDTLDLVDVAYDSGGKADLIGHQLQIIEGGQTYTLNLDPNKT